MAASRSHSSCLMGPGSAATGARGTRSLPLNSTPLPQELPVGVLAREGEAAAGRHFAFSRPPRLPAPRPMWRPTTGIQGTHRGPGVGDGLYGRGERPGVEKDRVPTIGATCVGELGIRGRGKIRGGKRVRRGPRRGAFGLETLRGFAYRANQGSCLLVVQVGDQPGAPVGVLHNLSFPANG
jgi:hypothetical protein